MLKEILAISGRPGLYRLVKYGKNVIIVENITDKKRGTASSRDKVISLGDISMYTDSGDKPLGEILEVIKKKYDAKPIDATKYKEPEALQAFFKEIVPDFDVDRVYNTDIKKLINWYNFLINGGITDFLPKEEENAEEVKEEKKTEE
ncbi:MAG: DUF5606 domain-containing protein [Muribaculaceae bacterium]|nr:DUF5606 domain-containing protein [Muribaculaceae bacterium]